MCSILTSQHLKHGNIQLDFFKQRIFLFANELGPQLIIVIHRLGIWMVHTVMHLCNELFSKTPNFSLVFVQIVCGVLS